MIPFLFGVMGLAMGAFAAYAAESKNRQAAKHYKKIANELSDKYTNLEKGYHQLTDENTKKIDELNQAREVIAQNTQIIDELTSRYENLEQEYHQVADENKQHLDNLANSQQLINRNKQFITDFTVKYDNLQKKYDELTAENTTQKELITEKTKIINELTDRHTNLQTELEEIEENLIIIPDDYYETLLESVTNNHREPLLKNILSIDLGRTSTKACVSREPGNVAFISANIKQIPCNYYGWWWRVFLGRFAKVVERKEGKCVFSCTFSPS
ncbi:hypothetical protein H6G59_24975 [Anabaena lutea FACHB-196]|uniref:Chromosome partition protein Smc n=1 Tax=Anabaena lutea FACHB-196 TaxID=2692881 RepID=A0ABR8FLN0_9NOST|nr:hypothetical protein [Anabaena lutea FACHB-196]